MKINSPVETNLREIAIAIVLVFACMEGESPAFGSERAAGSPAKTKAREEPLVNEHRYAVAGTAKERIHMQRKADSAACAKCGSASFPNASNTGVVPGMTLSRYVGVLRVTTDNAIISDLEVVGSIIIEAKNVTLKNIRLISATWHALWVMDNAVGFTLMDSEIDGGGLTDNGILGFGTILRCNIHDVENGLSIWGPSVVRGNFIHDLRTINEPDPHFDGIQISGGHNIDIIGNTVINENSQTAAIMMGNTFAGLSNIRIDGNRLVGGGYTIYLDGRKGGGPVDDASISITNNQIGSGYYGEMALYDQQPVLSGNVSAGHSPDAGGDGVP